MTLGGHLHETAKRLPDKTALIWGGTQLTYREFDEQTTRLALGLQARGIKKGDRVALHMRNTIELSLAFFGCFKIGAIAVPVNDRLKTDEIAYMLQHSEARMYIGEPELYQRVEPARDSIPHVGQFLVTSRDGASDTVSYFGELLSAPKGGSLPVVAEPDVAAILYTSGTTARPKGVTHTHATLSNCGRIACQLAIDENETGPLYTPMTHVSGLVELIITVQLGASAVLISGFEPQAILKVIEEHRCTSIGGMPIALQALIREQAANPRDVSSLRTCTTGGDSLAIPVQTEFRNRFGIPVQEVIAMTEAIPICFNRSDRIKTGSVGEAADGVEVRILDDDGREAPLGVAGEMVVRHPGTAVGYWNDPRATSDAIRDGWLYTGDLASKDEDGFYWFAGRKKEIIVRGGSNISPQEVEGALLDHPAVFQAGVVGVPDPSWGESVVAFVRPHDDASCSERELIGFTKQHLADYKTPAQVHFIDEMPLGLTGKVCRKTLRETVQERQSAGA